VLRGLLSKKLSFQKYVRALKAEAGRLNIESRTGMGTIIQAVLPLDVIDQPTDDVRDPVCRAVIHPH